MEAMPTAASGHFSRESDNFEEVFKNENLMFSDNLKDLKYLSKQLFSAAEYFEVSYMNDNRKPTVVNNLKDYTIKAVVSTVDHLGSITYKVNDLLDERVDEVSGNELRVSCIEQRLRTCQDYIDLEGVSQQSLMINAPKYHKRYIFPVGEEVDGAIPTDSENEGCSLNDGHDWSQFQHDIDASVKETSSYMVSYPTTKVSPTFCSTKISGPPASPKHSQQPGDLSLPFTLHSSVSSEPVSPKSSHPSTTDKSWSSFSNPLFGGEMHISEPSKGSSIHIRFGEGNLKDGQQNRSKGIRLLKALLSRRKPKKDDMLYTYLDEY